MNIPKELKGLAISLTHLGVKDIVWAFEDAPFVSSQYFRIKGDSSLPRFFEKIPPFVINYFEKETIFVSGIIF